MWKPDNSSNDKLYSYISHWSISKAQNFVSIQVISCVSSHFSYNWSNLLNDKMFKINIFSFFSFFSFSFSMSIEEENSMTPENFQTEKLTANRRKESGFLEYFLLVKMIPQFQSVNLCQNYYDKSHSFLWFTWWLILLDGNLYQWWWSFEILCLVHKLT